jgi:gas vesicle protein
MKQSESKGSGAGIGAIVGFLCGVGVGLLFAKKPGKETRQQLAELMDKGRKTGEDLLQQGREKIASAKERMASEGDKEPFYESGKYT